MQETTVCEIISNGRILLKLASRGVSKGKWNGLGGKIDEGETPEQCAIREVREESGLIVKNLRKVGLFNFYKGSRESLFVAVHVFATDEFSGELEESDEGQLKWFALDSIPYREMWSDDIFWFPLLFKGYRFDADFIFDEGMEMITSYEIRNLSATASPFS